MNHKLRNLKTKKYTTLLIIAMLLVFVAGLFTILNPSVKKINIKNVLSKTTSLNASVIDGVDDGVSSNNYDEIKYKLKINKLSEDVAVITGSLTNSENKYARFKEIKDSVVSNNGRNITITTTKNNPVITVVVENAPYGVAITPEFKINSEDESKSKINVDPVVITGRSVEGKVFDETGTMYKGLELSLSKDDKEIKRTYTKENGEYTFSLGDVDTYEVKLEEEKYQVVRYTEETTDENRRILNIVVREVEPFNAEIKKSISKLDLIVNGKKETFEYDEEPKVVRSVKNAKTIEGSIYYKINIKNTGEVKGTLTVLKDIIPDGLSFDENKNPGWKKDGKYLFYTAIEDKELGAYEKTSASLVLDIVKTNEARNYINTAITSGEDYKYVAYYLNNKIFREEYVSSLEKIENINPGIEDFDGWYTDKEYTNKYNFDNTVTKDIVLFGKIKNNKYTITFIDRNPNTGEEIIIGTKEVEEGNAIDIIDAPTYKGYTFKCYEANGTCYNDENVQEDLTLYAKYKINTYNIEYNLDGGTLPEDNPSTYTVSDEFTLNNPSKEGYTFIGWVGTDLTEETLNLQIKKGSVGDREYTACYAIKKSTLSIDPNGGTYLDNASVVTYEEDYGTIRQIAESVKRGYSFIRYDKTGGGVFLNNTFTFNDEDATLTAAYEINTYNILYNEITEEERNLLNNPTTYNVETNTFKLNNPDPRKDEHGNNLLDFLGWNDGNGNTSINVTIEKGSIDDRTYTAVWGENQDSYLITYDLDGGALELGKTNPTSYKRSTETFTLNNPSKEGYEFAGWSGTGITGTEEIVTISKGSAGVRNYVAHYTPITYNITYEGITTEERNLLNNPTTYNIESETITLNEPSTRKDEHGNNLEDFLGWNDGNGNISINVSIPKGSIGNRTYTAEWHENQDSYLITYDLDGGALEPGKTNPSSYKRSTATFTLNNPSKPGYAFAGWSGTEIDGTSLVVTISKGSAGVRNYVAHYTPITYNISYEGITTEERNLLKNPTTYNVETDTFTLNIPSTRKDEHGNDSEDFLGWNDGNGNTSTNVSIPKGSIGNKTYTAVWHENQNDYSITYDLDGGALEPGKTNPNSYKRSTATFTLNNPSKPGYNFTGWSGTGITGTSTEVTISKGSSGNRTYTANYEAITYNITYSGITTEERDLLKNPTTYNVETDTFTLNIPASRKDGQGLNLEDFAGWNDGNGNISINVSIPKGSIGNKTYTAEWHENQDSYPIAYDLDGGTLGEPNPSSYKRSTTTFTLNNPSKPGYTFAGWSGTGITGTSTTVTIPKGSAGVRNYVAHYTPITYNISYEGITTEERNLLKNPTTYNVETDTFTLNIPASRKDGQGLSIEDFAGWNDGNGNISINVSIPKGSIGDREYTAEWHDNEDVYNITYNLNDGVYEPGKTNPSTYMRKTETFTLNNPSKPGYNFTGWSGTGITGTSTEVTIPKGSSGNRSYVANFEKITYSINYSGLTQAEMVALNNPTTYDVETATFSISNPQREGYNFLGWSGTDIANKSTSVIVLKGSTGNRNYTANFEKIEYTISYTLNNGKVEQDNPTKYSVDSASITLNNPSKVGYNFIGWEGTDLVGNTNLVVTIPTGSTGHRSYTANYEPITYNLTYDYDGGSLDDGKTNPSTYNIETPDILLNNPSKEGYEFINYTIDNVIVTGIPTGSTGNKHLVAHYEISKYDVNFYNESALFTTEDVNWNSKATIPSSIPTKGHHIFLYWSEDGINEYDFNTLITEDKNLYAVYEEVISPMIEITPSLDNETNKTWVCGNSSTENCGVLVTLSSEHNEYELYYKIGDGALTLYTEPFKVYSNETITAVSKKSNIYSTDTNETIVNVDTISPTINNPGTGAASFNMTVSGTAQDAGSGVKKFTLYAREKSALIYDENLTYESPIFDGVKDHAENYDHTFYGVEQDTEYIVKIVAEDYVGNVSEREVEVRTNPYIARVVGKNGILWYTVDSDTKEIVVDQGREFLLFDSIQSAVNYCANVQCTIQTNPTIPVVNENIIVAADQDITIDLDGRGITSDASATFVNNGKLQIVDRNPRSDNTIGTVKNTVNKAIVNNGTFILGEGSSEVSDTFINPEMDRPIIEGKTAALEQNDEFHFYDGKLVADTLALINNGADAITQYSYNVIFITENYKNVAKLARVTDPQARIKSTYYAKLKDSGVDNAFDSSNSGTFEEEKEKMLSKIKQYGDYGFIYDAVNETIVNGNNSTSNTTAISYLKLDLTDEEEDKFLTFTTFADTYNSDSYGYISISETLSSTGTQIYRSTGNDINGNKIYKLTKGKAYYLYFGFVKGGGDINPIEIFKISNFNILGERQETSDFALLNDTNRYSFERQDDGSYKSTNPFLGGTYAHSYIIYDLRDQTEGFNILVNASISSLNNNDHGYVYVSNNENFLNYDSASSIKKFDMYGVVSNRTYTISLTPGELNYVHFCYYNYNGNHGGDDTFTINNVALTNAKGENILSQSTLLHNNNDTYYFNNIDYDLFTWKDSSSNHNNAILNGPILNSQSTGLLFDGNNDYGYVDTSNYNLNNYEESVYTEFSTTSTNNMVIYMGSSRERIVVGLSDGRIQVSNGVGSDAAWYNRPSNFNNGSKHSILTTYKEGNYEVYYDGTKLTKGGTWRITGATTNAYIGRAGSNGNYWNGTIYNIKVYNKEITPEEINNPDNIILNLDGSNSKIPTEASFISNNAGVANSTAHSYIMYDLTNVNEDKYLYVNATISSHSYNYGSVYVTDSTSVPSGTSGREIYVSGVKENQTGILRLQKNKVNYVHFLYTKSGSYNTESDKFFIKEIRYCNSLEDAYSINANNYSTISEIYFDNPVLNQEVDTIEILKQITLDSAIEVPEEKEVILDLNGFTLTSNKNDYVIKNNGNLKIIDGKFEENRKRNINYKTEQARLYNEAKNKYLADLTEYNEYAGLCENCEPSEEYIIDNSLRKEIPYSGHEETFNVGFTGTYKLEVWGAQGGSYSNSIYGGYGGYSVGTVELTAGDTLYINVGGAGKSVHGSNTTAQGGYNGGGNAVLYHGNGSQFDSGSGGGATHIATSQGILSELESDQSSILIVAGGGGGSSRWDYGEYGAGGSAGGYVGNNGGTTESNRYGTGGTQSSGGYYKYNPSLGKGSFGQGGQTESDISSRYLGGAGGGGYYGGGAAGTNYCTGGGGGSGYIGNQSLDNKAMYCYYCTEATDVNNDKDIFTISTKGSTEYIDSENCPNGFSSDPVSKCAKANDGYAKITFDITDEELEEMKKNLPKTYNVKTLPVFKDYLSEVDFDSSVDVDNIDIDSEVSYNNIVSEAVNGTITSTTSSILLNEEHATLNLSSGAINININSKYGIVNRGKLIIGEGAIINANNAGTIGIYNETNGDIVSSSGVINAIGNNSTGLYNRSNDPSISGIKVVTTPTDAKGIRNEAVADVTYTNINVTGAGEGFREYATGNTIISNSNISSTGNDSIYFTPQAFPLRFTINSSSLYGSVSLESSPRMVSINNSSLTTLYNSFGNVSINSSTLNYINNRGEAVINDSTLTGSGTIIFNEDGNYSRGGIEYVSKLLLKNSIVNSTATSNKDIVDNDYYMTVYNTRFNNVNGAKSTVFNNTKNYVTPYLNITGNTYIDSSFGTAINNNGVVTIGSDEKNVDTEYEFGYTGAQEVFTAPQTGTYKLETWGAAASDANGWSSGYKSIYRGGFGAYASGTITLNKGDKLYIHVGGHGSSGTYWNALRSYYGAYNGGGATTGYYNDWTVPGTGGGATDISLSSEDNTWYYDNGVVSSRRSTESYEQRIIVAGGGGSCYYTDNCYGGYQTTSTTLGYGDRNSGGGYYGGSSYTGGSSYVSSNLSNIIMKTGNEEMPDYSTSGLVKGNVGNGHAKITLLNGSSTVVSNTPTISSTNYGIVGSGRFNFYDGTISANTAINSDIENVPEGYDIYKSIDNSKEKIILVSNANSRPVADGEESYVAQINNSKYTTIQNAVDAANNGDEIDLLVDINQQNTINISDTKAVTIDYNGHIVKSYSDKYLFNNQGNLTITDSTNSLRKNSYYGDKYIYNEGTLTVSKLYIGNYDYSISILENNNGVVTLDKVKFDFGNDNNVSNKVAITNTESGTIIANESIFNLWYTNNMFNNKGTLTVKDSNVTSSAGKYFVYNFTSGTVTLDGNSYSVSGGIENYFLNSSGTATIKNMTTTFERIYNEGILTLESNTLPSGSLNSPGLLRIKSGTYSNSFTISGSGKIIDNTNNQYSLIIENGTINSKLNISATGITNIEGGTINVSNDIAINNSGSGIINLGIHDGNVDSKENTKPIINGKSYGIYTSNPALLVNFYDGIVSGQKAYNVSIDNVENGYSIHRDYDSVGDIESKYLTSEPVFRNITQGKSYTSVDELNTDLSNGTINNNDVIQALRNITITRSENPITIPSGLKITFDINNNIIDNNNNTMFIINGELDTIDSTNSNIVGKIDSTTGNIFVNNGTLNILSGTYVSEAGSTESEVVLNNSNLNISGGVFTKYYDKLGYRQTNSGTIVNNSGVAIITNGTFYSNSSFIESAYRRGTIDNADYIYSSSIFVNNSLGTLNVSGGTYDGIASRTWRDNDSSWRDYSTASKGELIYNYGTATISGIVSDNSHIGLNQGTLTLDDVTMENIINLNTGGTSGLHPNLINTGSLTISDSTFEIKASFVENNGGNISITNTTIDRTANGSGYRTDNDDLYGVKNSHLIRNKYNSNNDNSINISGSYLYNRGSGEVIENRGLLIIENSTIEAFNNAAINSYSSRVDVKKNSSIISDNGRAIYLSSSTFNLGESIEIDGAVSKTYPIIKGTTYGVYNSSSTINFYDGILMGKTDPTYGTITNLEVGYGRISGTSDDYKTNYLDKVYVIKNVTQSVGIEKKYYDLKSAFDEANSGDTLQMINDYNNLTIDEAAVVSNIVTFDLNGKTIRQSNDKLFVNNGELTIIDSSNGNTGEIIAISGTTAFDNNGTINLIDAKVSTNHGILLFKNNSNSTLVVKDEGIITSSTGSTLIDNSGTVDILNGAYLHNINAHVIINRNILNIVDLNNDNDQSTDSLFDAPWIHCENNGAANANASIRTVSGGTTNIYGGVYNNGQTYNSGTPTASKIVDNSGTTIIKNLDSYSYFVGENNGSLTIENSHFYNFEDEGIYSRYGTLNVKDTTFEITTTENHFDNFKIYSGYSTFDHVTIIGRNSGSYRGALLYAFGITTIKNNSTINVDLNLNSIVNGSTLNIENSIINNNIYNEGTLNIDSSDVTFANVAISNTNGHTVNIKNGSNITSTGNNAINTSGTVNVTDASSIVSNNGIAINLIDSATLNLGEIGGTPDTDYPYISGTTFGIYRNTQSTSFNFYDGLVIGKSGPNAISGGVTSVESGYETRNEIEINPNDQDDKTYKEYLVVSATSIAVAKVGTYSFASVGDISPSKALQNAVNFAIGDGSNVRDIDLLTNIDLVTDQASITASMPVTINLSGYTITGDSTYKLSSNITLNTNNNLGANVSKLLSDVFDISSKPKNIVIYELSDGSKLDTSNTYKLYKDGKLISLEKEELGRYKYKGNSVNLTPIKGRLYIDNLYNGSYKLESSDNKTIEFSIDNDGIIKGNVAENVNNSSQSISDSSAELILNIQTGVSKHYYLLVLIPILLVTLLLIITKNKRREI